MNPLINSDIHTFKNFTTWVVTLADIDTHSWTNPIAAGKWSTSEILSHLQNWDHYLISHILPSVRRGEDMVFPDFDTYNKVASDYAKSGITPSALIEEVIRTRETLVSDLLEMPENVLHAYLPCNGIAHCPHTGEPYSLAYIVKEFVMHDHFHKQQIVQFLNEKAN